jgi:hypothetical protein
MTEIRKNYKFHSAKQHLSEIEKQKIIRKIAENQ